METTHSSIPTDIPIAAALEPRPGVIFWRALRDNIPGILAWGGGYGGLLLFVVLLFPALQSNDTLVGIVRSLGLLGVADNGYITIDALMSFPGYIALEALSWAPIILSIYLIPQALGAVLREEERGTLDILLSTPLPRWRLLTEKMLAIIVSLACILALMWVILVISVGLVDGVELPLMNALAGVWHVLPISLAIAAFGVLISVSVANSRAAAGWIALALMTSYFLRTISDLMYEVDWLLTLKQLSIFAYYRSIAALSTGFQWPYDAAMLALAGVFFALALWQFQHRDVGV